MSDSESSELVDSEAGLEEMEDEKLLSSDPEDNSNELSNEEELNEEEESVEEEFLEDSGEDEELSSEDEEEKKLTEDELRRIHLDDFSSDDEVWFEYYRIMSRKPEIQLGTFQSNGMISMITLGTI